MKLALAALLLLAQDKQDDWKPLFNGKDLENWTQTGSAKWKVEDGIILGGQDGDPKKSGFLCTKDQFQDFELSLDFMIDEHGKYNSGIYLRNDPLPSGQSGYQVNIGRAEVKEYCGGVVVHKDKGIRWVATGDEKDEVRKIKEWNTMKVLAKGAHLEVELNGKKIVDVTDPEPKPKFLQKGILAFQTYGAEGHAGWIKLRNLKIREVK